MDPFTALSVAAAAIQFFEFAKGLLKGYQERQDGARRLTEESFNVATEDLAVWVATLGKCPRRGSKEEAALLEQELALRNLAAECGKIARNILDALKKLQPTAKQSRWTSLSQALQSMWQAEDIAKLRQELDVYRNEIVIRVLACLNEKMDLSMGRQKEQLDTIQRNNDEIVGVLAFNHQELHKAILELKNGQAKTIMQDESLNMDQRATVRLGTAHSLMTLRAPRGESEAESTIEDFGLLKDQILNCLHFRQIVDRLGSVPEAHTSTFHWIFSNPKESQVSWNSFPEWLQNGTGCYWIQGKAGSGKSTLMKRIYEHQQTTQHLQHWAKGLPLTTASFFFWHLGSPLQKSQEGLLRSILYDLLRTNPRLVMDVMPELCIEVTKLGREELVGSPSLSELVRWFKKLGKACGSSTTQRACFFIDGLDEYVGDQAELVSLFLNLSRETTAIKFVLSSRPISVFVETLSALPGLRLQDLTMDDIEAYTADLLGNKAMFVDSEEVEALIAEIARKSCGVFLWVVVVVRSLLEGLRDGDTVQELRKRVDEMPSELESLYQHMLGRIPAQYQSQAAEMLQLVAANFAGHQGPQGKGFIYPLPAIQLSFALEKDSHALQARIMEITPADEAKRVQHIEARTRSRCLGLIELRHPLNLSLPTETFHRDVIEPFHRTAMEFLGDPDVSAMLKRLTAKTAFNPYLSLFCSTIWMAKISPSVVVVGTDEYDRSPHRNLRPALSIASSAELRGCPIPAKYLDELDRVLCTHWETAHAYNNLRQPESNSEPNQTLGHWFTFALKQSADCLDVPTLLGKLNRTKGTEIRDGREPQDTDGATGTRPVLYSNALLSVKLDTRLPRQLLDCDRETGFLSVALTLPLSDYLQYRLEKVSTTLTRADLTRFLSFLAHTQFYLELTDFEVDVFTTRTQVAFASLLQAGADANFPAYNNYSIWSLFLCSAFRGVISNTERWKLDEGQCLVLERILMSFIMHEADLSTSFHLVGQNYTPTTLLTRAKVRTEIELRALNNAPYDPEDILMQTRLAALDGVLRRTLDFIESKMLERQTSEDSAGTSEDSAGTSEDSAGISGRPVPHIGPNDRRLRSSKPRFFVRCIRKIKGIWPG
ncbi:hypothetical protein EDB81DRAFT_875669 [Dactylonectria macrodidyma]|uniref:NACHT domain-containing protein n=1 Tax=Dactylonectria macrodidyma TaxID=307937 RepID=A0A9P9JS44_9HYPO|nr:hypothetical protein EDB81DRAFT_875669 [Dactylonectria macrodidyma]